MKLNPCILTYQNLNCVVVAHDLCIFLDSVVVVVVVVVSCAYAFTFSFRELLFVQLTYSLLPVKIMIYTIYTLVIIGLNIFSCVCMCYVVAVLQRFVYLFFIPLLLHLECLKFFFRLSQLNYEQ